MSLPYPTTSNALQRRARLGGFLLVAFAVLVVARLRRVEVAGESMRPTLEPGDRLLVRLTNRARIGDLVAVRDPREPERVMVKRVTAAGPGGLEVRGDNETASTDSRTFGAFPRSLLVGVAVYRYAPEERRSWLRRSTAASASSMNRRTSSAAGTSSRMAPTPWPAG